MPSSYSTRLRLELQADGESDNTWGQKANTVFELLDEAVEGYLALSVAGSSDVTLTSNNSATDQSRQKVLKFTGTLTGNINVIVPAIEKNYIVWNATSGAFSLTFKPSGGTGLVIPQNGAGLAFTDGSTMLQSSPWVNPTDPPATLITDDLFEVADPILFVGGASGGTANAQTLTPAIPLPGYVAGTMISFIAGVTNTAALTMNISGLGIRSVKSRAGAALIGGEVVAGSRYMLDDDGTNLLLVNGSVGQVKTAFPSATSLTISDIPPDARRITLLIDEVSTAGTAEIRLQLGVAAGFITAGYEGTIARITASGIVCEAADATGIALGALPAGTSNFRGRVVLEHEGANAWTVESKLATGSGGPRQAHTVSRIELADVLTQLKFLSSDAFDLGSVIRIVERV